MVSLIFSGKIVASSLPKSTGAMIVILFTGRGWEVTIWNYFTGESERGMTQDTGKNLKSQYYYLWWQRGAGRRAAEVIIHHVSLAGEGKNGRGQWMDPVEKERCRSEMLINKF